MKEWLKSVLNYRSYPKIKLDIRFFWTTLYIKRFTSDIVCQLYFNPSKSTVMPRLKSFLFNEVQ